MCVEQPLRDVDHILAIFSAMAGAKKVYAVEATDMAKHARMLVAHNKVGLVWVCVGLVGWAAVAATRGQQ